MPCPARVAGWKAGGLGCQVPGIAAGVGNGCRPMPCRVRRFRVARARLPPAPCRPRCRGSSPCHSAATPVSRRGLNRARSAAMARAQRARRGSPVPASRPGRSRHGRAGQRVQSQPAVIPRIAASDRFRERGSGDRAVRDVVPAQQRSLGGRVHAVLAMRANLARPGDCGRRKEHRADAADAASALPIHRVLTDLSLGIGMRPGV